MENYQTSKTDKNKFTVLILCFFGGLIGLHYFYVGDIRRGVLYLFTGGMFGVGWVIDIFKILRGKFETPEDVRIEKIENSKWKLLEHNFYISEEYQRLRINKREIDFSSIIDVDLIEEGTSISKTTGENITKGKSQKHIAPVKGLIGFGIAGPVGAIIGGTSGKTDIETTTTVNTVTQNIDYCTNLSLKITLNDISNPMIIYKLINIKTRKDSFTYASSYKKAQKCISIIQAIISRNKQTLT